jgi:isopenicillin N synthase-like dioxygenase
VLTIYNLRTKAATIITNTNTNIPLVSIETSSENIPTNEVAYSVTNALRESGFLIITAPELTSELQQRAIRAASEILKSESPSTVVSHPSDPKIYAMLHGVDFDIDRSFYPVVIQDLREWYKAVRSTKDILLRCIAIGLGMDDINFFVNLHNQHNDSLRLIRYHPGDENTGNRCKAHSDYGTITLLLTDGVGGLEAFIGNEWKPVPYIKGAVVVNIGSILSQWTKNELSATRHRVAGPASLESNTPHDDLMRAVNVPRISLAYFADPNEDVSIRLDNQDESAGENSMNVLEYIRWRSGGEGAKRDGVPFISLEKDRLDVK